VPYELQVERAARRNLAGVPADDYARLERAIDALAEEPRPRGSKKLRAPAPMWRIRVGTYRVIYSVFERERIVKILAVARRGGRTYERLP
jgi:mRNA interferase RelE/StbE